METNPPPYNPQLIAYPRAEPTAPAIDQVYPDNLLINQSNTSPLIPESPDEYSPDYTNYFFDDTNLEDRPPDYDACCTEISSESSTQEVRPLRCKSGTVYVGVGDCSEIDQIRSWKSQYIEVRDCTMYVSPTKDKRNQQVSISLQNRYVSMPGKRLISIQGGHNSLLIKCNTEISAHQWFMTFSQYCFVAPMMEGFCDKLNRGKNIFQERFLRLSSDGILSWYRNDSDDAERRGSIQLRGERCEVDGSNSRLVLIHVEPRGYQFRFYSSREAQLWLAAFQWHYGRRPLRKAAVPLRNKVK